MLGKRDFLFKLFLLILLSFLCIPVSVSYAVTITHGPRIGLVTATEATIYWDTDVEIIGEINYGVKLPYDTNAKEDKAVTNHRITIKGLSSAEAGTSYFYQIVSGEAKSESTFTTAPTAKSAIFKFATMGDNRGQSDTEDIKDLPETFKQLLADAEKRDPAFAFNIGDIFYGYTPEIERMRQLYASFKRATDPLAKKVPYLVSPGGHEMSPYNKTDKNKGFDPLALWNEQLAQPQILKGHEGTTYSWDWGNTHFTSIDSDLYEEGKSNEGLCVVDDNQIEWLEHDLAQAQKRGARHLFVLSHCNAFRENGETLFNQGSVNVVQRDKFWDVLEKFNVDAYITGHEHRFVDTLAQEGGEGSNKDFKVIQWLNGNCGFDADPKTGKHQYTLWTVDGDTVQADLIDTEGTINYTKTFTSRQPATTTLMRKGPYLLYPNDNTKMTVLWQTNYTPSVAKIEWGTTASYGNGPFTVTESGPGGDEHQFSYPITGLAPGTRYYYKVSVGSESENVQGSFMTAPDASAKSLVFYGYGDTILSKPNLNSVSGQIMTDVAKNFTQNATLILHSGDIAWDGNEEPYLDSYFSANYANYTSIHESLNTLPIMVAIGNHEGQVPKGDAQLDYGKQFRKYWPHSFVKQNYYSFDYGPLHVTAIDVYNNAGDPDFAPGSDQYKWIENDITNSTKPWKVVLFHAPPYSVCQFYQNQKWGTDARNYLVPLFEKLGVKIILNGHEHLYSRSLVNGITYLTLGGGAAPPFSTAQCDPLTSPSYSLMNSKFVLNYAKFEINGDDMAVTVFDVTNNAVLESIKIPPSGTPASWGSSKIAALFTGYGADSGLWGNDGTNWNRLTDWQPLMVTGYGSNGIAASFSNYGDGNGLWKYDGSSWTRISDWVPTGMISYGSANLVGKFADYGSSGNGIWRYDGTSWTRLSDWIPAAMVSLGSNEIAAMFNRYGSGNGLWYNDGSNWNHITDWISESISSWGARLTATFTNYSSSGNGLWIYENSSWRRVTDWAPSKVLSWKGDTLLAATFTKYGSSGNGIWNYDGSSWSRLTDWVPLYMTNLGSTDLIAVFKDYGTGNGVWKYSSASSSWTKISEWIPDTISSSGDYVTGVFSGYGTSGNGVWKYSSASSSWTRISDWLPKETKQ